MVWARHGAGLACVVVFDVMAMGVAVVLIFVDVTLAGNVGDMSPTCRDMAFFTPFFRQIEKCRVFFLGNLSRKAIKLSTDTYNMSHDTRKTQFP